MDLQSLVLALVQVLMVIILILIAAIDAKTKVINQRLLLVLLLGSIFAVFASQEVSLISAFAAMLLMFLILSLIYLVSKKALGWGDVKLCVCIAPYLGIEGAFTMLFAAMVLCGLISILLLLGSKAKRPSEIPFAPFVALGTIIALLL